MGVDVYGKSGNHFARCYGNWRPLADYIYTVAPEVTANFEHWQSNDGDGLDAAEASALATKLNAELVSGRTEAYAVRDASARAMMPDVGCWLCDGSGTRKPLKPHPELGAGDPTTNGIKCNVCHGRGYVCAPGSQYRFDVEDVREFAHFLGQSGGFEIW